MIVRTNTLVVIDGLSRTSRRLTVNSINLMSNNEGREVKFSSFY